jgi:murein DD-endopeptidase MepM/ murein hydrolase activator NlpD
MMKVCTGRISSPFGYRTHPVTGEKEKHHNGVDIAAPLGTPVYCPVDGTATLVATGPIEGLQIHVTNGCAEFHFLHLSAFMIKQGDKVTKGMQIAKVGATGRVTGPHLHYAVKEHGKFINPVNMIDF